MWKPFLARSLPSVFGGRRHDVSPRAAGRIFSRAYAGRELRAGGDEGTTSRSNHHQQKQLRLPQQRRHLYVVLRDWCTMNYSLHKLNLDDALKDTSGGASEGNGMDGAQKLRRMPGPILRIGSRRIGPRARIHALGSNIVITGAAYRSKGVTLVYDTDTAELEIGEDTPDEVGTWTYDAVAAGDKLHAVQVPYYLCEAPQDANERWTWASGGRYPIPIPMPTSADESYKFRAHAVHPDGRTVFVSIDYHNKHRLPDTFSLDTETGEWTHRGSWRLPFHGQGHYDADLDAWVGVVCGADEWPPCRDNYLSSCDVPALADGPTPQPAWKHCEQKLTFVEAPLTAADHAPVLVHTGNGRLCFVETADTVEQDTPGRHCYTCRTILCRTILRVTMFRPKFGKNGELVMAAAPRSSRSYLISSADSSSFNGPAFWM